LGWSPFRKTGLTHHLASASFKGYTLVAPIAANATYLIDMAGRIVHRWHYPEWRGFNSQLLPNGRLLLMCSESSRQPPVIEPGTVPAFDVNIRRIGGNATHLLELDWDGSVVWSYANQAIHHDYVRLPDGNTLLPEFIELPPDVARSVRGGHRTREKLPPMLSDDIIEISPEGKEVARTHLWQLLDPRRDPICPLDRPLEWTHTNSLDVTAAGDVLFSCRSNSRIGIIEQSGQRLLWKHGAPDTHHQHHASALANGNVQVFDNGMHRHDLPRSAVLEINPRDNSIAWQYSGNPPASFFSAHISGAERLPGGNVLITEGAPGRIFEITSGGEVVWEFINPFGFRMPNGTWMTFVFRAHRYSADYAGIQGRELDPARYRALNQSFGLVE
jgi:hypothetical protein